MISIITGYLLGRHPFESEEYMIIAHDILSICEAQGMLPPGAHFKGTRTGCLCTMRESCSSCGGYDINEWEPKEET